MASANLGGMNFTPALVTNGNTQDTSGDMTQQEFEDQFMEDAVIGWLMVGFMVVDMVRPPFAF
jgi:hypothetical protein